MALSCGGYVRAAERRGADERGGCAYRDPDHAVAGQDGLRLPLPLGLPGEGRSGEHALKCQGSRLPPELSVVGVVRGSIGLVDDGRSAMGFSAGPWVDRLCRRSSAGKGEKELRQEGKVSLWEDSERTAEPAVRGETGRSGPSTFGFDRPGGVIVRRDGGRPLCRYWHAD